MSDSSTKNIILASSISSTAIEDSGQGALAPSPVNTVVDTTKLYLVPKTFNQLHKMSSSYEMQQSSIQSEISNFSGNKLLVIGYYNKDNLGDDAYQGVMGQFFP